ncbi:T-cell surface glycoprotein CD5 [Puma concolor]|uniref:T-cell surface glycoprotein CD5 n=1 Tax=Puma concolor TaxID=9696 RepID=A0A6P6H6R2_PUMCO|nr:T-cell surface glycoprotein CD5 [Puma concolor]
MRTPGGYLVWARTAQAGASLAEAEEPGRELPNTVAPPPGGVARSLARRPAVPSLARLRQEEAAPMGSQQPPLAALYLLGVLGEYPAWGMYRGSCPSFTRVCFIAEPPRTAPPPTTPPPTTTPQPTAPPRLQLVAGPGGLRCAGVVEFYWGSRGGAISYEAQDKTQDLENRICEALQCGSFLKHLPEEDTSRAQDPEESRPLPIRWKIQNTSCTSLEQCFSKVQPREGGQALAIVCSDFQPKVQSRLVGRRSLCEGSVEVRQGKQWEVLCDGPRPKGTARWEEVCQELQCGSVDSYRVLDAIETSHGLFCPQEKLSQCYQLQEKKAYCRRVFVTCHDPNPAGPGAGTVMSIILGLVLLAVLLVVCGPHAYRKLVKKFRQKKQRQWIGPTGMNQNMSFHRNHTATVRSQVENPAVSHVENEYSHPPRNSHISACPALEGALHRVSTQPDNSSDSDYDLHGAQRL